MNEVIVDVREKDEFECEHIEYSVHVPLGEFSAKAPALLHHMSDKKIVIMCRSGKRAQMAIDQVRSQGLSDRLKVFEGGILEWKKQGRPTVVKSEGHFPIMRQVQIVAGSLVLLSVTLATFVDFKFIGLSAFVGAGLTFAGFSGFCGMAEVLRLMPWNKGARSDNPCRLTRI